MKLKSIWKEVIRKIFYITACPTQLDYIHGGKLQALNICIRKDKAKHK